MSKRRLSKHQRARVNKRAHAGAETINPDWETGVVVAHHGKRVEIQTGELFNSALPLNKREILTSHIRANLPTLVCGDRVYFQRFNDKSDNGADCVIEKLQVRESVLNRPRPYSDPKPFAANVDLILLVIAPQPEPITNLIDRYLIAAENTGIEVFIIINKTDLLDEETQAELREELQTLATLYESLDYSVFALSALDDHNNKNSANPINCQSDQKDLYSALAGKTGILVGQSGVGKSTIINAMAESPIALTGDISDSTVKGRHTTTHSSLFLLKLDEVNRCAVIDSPGVREFGLWHLSDEDIFNGLREFRPLANLCKFRDCDHKNSEGCAIQAAFKSGEISPSRIASYQHILASKEEH